MRIIAVTLIIIGVMISGAAAVDTYDYPTLETNHSENISYYWSWSAANTSYVDAGIYNGTYAVAAGGGGGPPITAAPTQTGDINITPLSAAQDAMDATMGLIVTMGKVVSIFAVLGIVLIVMRQTGVIPVWPVGNANEEVRANGVRQVERMVVGGQYGQPEVQPAASQEPPQEPSKKPEKRDRYEVVRV